MNQRKIKFRAFDVEKKIMYPVREISFSQNGSTGLLGADNREGPGRVYLGERTLVDVGNKNRPEGYVDDYPIMQFTGLKDMDGKEIYEGDILKISSKPPYEDGRPLIRKVSFEPRAPACGFILGDVEHDYIEHFGRIMKDDDTDWDVEVIGNVWETPQLLKTN